METGWKTVLRVYAPYLVLLAVNVVGAFYAFAYAAGQRSILSAAQQSATEAVRG